MHIRVAEVIQLATQCMYYVLKINIGLVVNACEANLLLSFSSCLITQKQLKYIFTTVLSIAIYIMKQCGLKAGSQYDVRSCVLHCVVTQARTQG